MENEADIPAHYSEIFLLCHTLVSLKAHACMLEEFAIEYHLIDNSYNGGGDRKDKQSEKLNLSSSKR